MSVARITTMKVGLRGGSPRIFIAGAYLREAGFRARARIEATFGRGRVTLRPSERGRRRVHFKGERPVIDLNTRELAASFGEVKRVRVKITDGLIEITATRPEAKRQSRCRNGREGSVFSGCGLLSKAAELAGFAPAFAIERDERYAATYAANFPRAELFNQCVSEVETDELPEVELLTLGIPCEPFSSARTTERGTRAKRDRSIPFEAHPLGDMTLFAATIISRLNPATVVVEESPKFLDSAAGYMLRHYLTRLGYEVEARVVEPALYGELQNRRRAVVVATSGEKFDWRLVRGDDYQPRNLGDILDAPSEIDEGLWWNAGTKPWVFSAWEKHRARGNGFFSRKLTAESTSVPVLKRHYLSYNQSDAPVVAHPTEPDTYRFFTLSEVRRLFGVPDDFILDGARSVAGAMLCQGVLVRLFRRIIESATQIGAGSALGPVSRQGQLAQGF